MSGHRALLHQLVCSCREEDCIRRRAVDRALEAAWDEGHEECCGAGPTRYCAYATNPYSREVLSAPVSAQQHHDGTEGQGEGERAGEAACDACPEDHCNATGKPWCTDEETR